MQKKSRIIKNWIPKNKYSRLTVLTTIPTALGHYKCKCECGHTAFRTREELEFNQGTHWCSVGCTYRINLTTKRKPQDAAVLLLAQIYQKYQYYAKDTGYEFSLTIDEVKNLIYDKCYYCGATTKNRHGIDRVDRSVGYVNTNVVTCCSLCNRLKSAHSAGILTRVAQIYNKIQEFYSITSNKA